MNNTFYAQNNVKWERRRVKYVSSVIHHTSLYLIL